MKIKFNLLKALGIIFLMLSVGGTVYAAIITDNLEVAGLNVLQLTSCTVDGSGNGDYSTIQGCVDYLSSDGGTVYIKNGTYDITSTINLTSNVKIVGDGIDATVINISDSFADPSGSNAFFNVSEVNDIVIKDLTVRGNASTAVDGFGGTYTNLLIENCKFEYLANGINPSAGSGIIIRNNYLDNNNFGIYFGSVGTTRSHNVVVSGNIITNTDTGNGIYSYQVSNATYSNNVIMNTVGEAMDLEGSNNLVVSNNIIGTVTTDSGILVGGAAAGGTERVLIQGNIIYNTGVANYGIKLGSGETVASVSITNNILEHTGTGIFISIADNVKVSDNTLRFQNGYGIQANNVTSFDFSNNNIENSSSAGMYIYGAGTTDGVLNGNIINHTRNAAAGYGMQLNAANLTVVGNRIFGTRYGIYETGSAANNNLIVFNHLTGNSVATLYSTGTSSFTMGNFNDLYRLEANTTVATCASAVEGAIYFDTDTNKHYGCDGTNWNALY